MKCEEITKLIELYTADELDEAQHQEVAGHLKTCSACGEKVSALSGLTTRLKETFSGLNPRAELTGRILETCRTRPSYSAVRLSRLERVLTAVAAAVFIVVTIGFIYSLTRPVIPPQPLRPLPKEYTFANGSHMLIASDALVDIKEAESKVVLHQGRIYLDIVLPKDRNIEIITPAGTVTAYGTEFIVSVDKPEEPIQAKAKVSVLVLKGQVGLANEKGKVIGPPDGYLYALYADANLPPVQKETSHQNLQEIITTMKESF